MASTLIFLTYLLFLQFSSAHRIEILTTSRPDGNIAEFDCNKPADIVFILDGSKRMTWKDFSQQLDFVKLFIDDMDISRNIVRIGVATISTEIRTDFFLNTYRTKEGIKKALSNITDPQGKTHTWLALEYLHKKAFSKENGGRVGVPKIAIILTDGASQDRQKTLVEAERLHNESIRVYAIGIRNVDLTELKAIASKPENVYLSSDFSALKDIEASLKENVCKIVCGLTPLDVIFMMDESTSLWNDDFENQIEFVERFVKDSVIGPKYTQIGIVTFSTNITNHFFLNQHHYTRDLLSALKAMKRTYGESYTNKALRFIKDQGFTQEHGGRQGVPHVVIVITDGQSSLPTETRNAAVEIQKSGVIVFAIGVGTVVDVNELKIIAGNEARVFQVRFYQALKGIESPLFARVCTVRHGKSG